MSDFGKELADQVKLIILSCSLADFSIEGPKFKKAGGDELEAGDFFLIWRDCLITFQIKSRVVEEFTEENREVELGRIASRARRAVKQVKTVKRAMKVGALKLCENLRGVQIPFLNREFKKIIGIVIVGVQSKSGTDSGEFEVQVVGGVDTVQEIPVHVFSVSDFDALLSEIDTIPDLIKYLETRKILFESGQIMMPVAEKDYLAIYQTNYPLISDLLQNPDNKAIIERDTWKGIVKNNQGAFEKRERELRVSRVIDHIIGEVHTSIGFNLGDELENEDGFKFEPGTIDNYVFVAEELAAIPRIVRAQIGQIIVEKMKAAQVMEKGFSYFVYKLEEANLPTIFLAHRGDREERHVRLTDLVSCAYVHFGTERAFGVAMSAAGAKEHSFDFMYVERVEYKNEKEIKERARLIFGPLKKIEYGKWGTP